MGTAAQCGINGQLSTGFGSSPDPCSIASYIITPQVGAEAARCYEMTELSMTESRTLCMRQVLFSPCHRLHHGSAGSSCRDPALVPYVEEQEACRRMMAECVVLHREN